jgi:gliding motility-associated-like protein
LQLAQSSAQVNTYIGEVILGQPTGSLPANQRDARFIGENFWRFEQAGNAGLDSARLTLRALPPAYLEPRSSQDSIQIYQNLGTWTGVGSDIDRSNNTISSTQSIDGFGEFALGSFLREEDFFIPNAFSPDGDGINDRFEISGLEAFDNVSLQVFDRYGLKVYSSQNYGENGNFWRGRDEEGNELPQGTYYYVLDLNDGDEPFRSFVHIMR